MNVDAFAKAAEFKTKGVPKQTTTLTVRLTYEERRRLERLAGDRPISALVRSRLFGKSGSRKAKVRRTTPDNAALAQVLAALGRSNLSVDLNTIVWAVDAGKLSLDLKSLALVRQACIDIAAMRQDLIAALGLSAR